MTGLLELKKVDESMKSMRPRHPGMLIWLVRVFWPIGSRTGPAFSYNNVKCFVSEKEMGYWFRVLLFFHMR